MTDHFFCPRRGSGRGHPLSGSCTGLGHGAASGGRRPRPPNVSFGIGPRICVPWLSLTPCLMPPLVPPTDLTEKRGPKKEPVVEQHEDMKRALPVPLVSVICGGIGTAAEAARALFSTGVCVYTALVRQNMLHIRHCCTGRRRQRWRPRPRGHEDGPRAELRLGFQRSLELH